MKSWLLQTLFDIRYSYWFIPSLMAVGAIFLAVGMVAIDVYVFTEIPEGYEWLFRSEPSGARAILSTVAGSTITVAGVVFSMTIMAVSHATSNYGSRLLLQFLKDRRNQIALGTFIATFIYCLLVLRTVSSAESGDEFSGFIPHIAILGALGMALASVAVLIAFIHHVPDSIHIGKVAADRGRELIGRLDEMYPQSEEPAADAVLCESSADPSSLDLPGEVKSTKSGYLQTLDVQGLINFCSQKDMLVKVLKPAGDFIFRGESIIKFKSNAEQFEQSDLEHKLLNYFGIGPERTPAQDTRFLIEELTQVSIRALSPGINDPFTAITCVEWLGNAVAHVIDRPTRPFELRDDDDNLRLILPPFDFSHLCDLIFRQMRPYVVADVATCVHIAKVFQNILSCCNNEHRRKVIVEHAKLYATEALATCASEGDQERLKQAFSFVR